MENLLRVWANGLEFENPFIIASGPSTASGELIREAFDAGWAGAVIKTIKDEEVINSDVSPRLGVLRRKYSIIGLENVEMLSDKPIEYWVDEIKNLKTDYPGKRIIASIMGAKGVDTWQRTAERIAKAGADALELNFSCPNGVTAQGLGLAIGQDNEAIELLTEAVKSAVALPVIVKLTPNVTSISKAAFAALNAGADGICAINTVSSLIGVDLDTLSPIPDVEGFSTYGGLSGPCVKPIGLRCAAEISQAIKSFDDAGKSFYAVGGITDWKDSAEYIALGANVLQICTAVMLSGFSIIENLKKGLSDYLINKGYASLNDFRGAAVGKLVKHNELNRNYKVLPRIEKAYCQDCGECIKLCHESAKSALYKSESFIEVDISKCSGCSLCAHACPRHAITMIAA
jgi:dihydropyrimidine dehydrogenase (NAD+) subunit PreA